MKMCTEVNNFEELYSNSWSGAIDTLNDIARTHKTEELMNLLEEVFDADEEMPTATNINDFIWFERDYIYECLGLDETGGEIPTDDDEDDDEDNDEEDEYDDDGIGSVSYDDEDEEE